MLPRSKAKRPALSRLEVVLLLLIVLILLGICIPAVQEVRNGADIQTVNDLKQIALACHISQDDHKKLPPAFDKFGKMVFPASVHVHLLPYLDQDELYGRYLKAKGTGETAQALVPTFASPQDPTQDDFAGIQNFAANLRVFSDKGLNTSYDADMAALAGVEPGAASIPASFVDGTSNTILLATKFGVCGDGGSRYAAGPDSVFAAFFGQNAARVRAHPADPSATYQLSPGKDECVPAPLLAQSFAQEHVGLWVALGDGSCRLISPKISPETWNRGMQPNDKLELGDDW